MRHPDTRIASWAIRIAGSLLVLILVGPAVRADQIVLEPVRDATLFSGGFLSPGDIASGSGPQLFAGRTTSFGVRRTLLAFDVAGSLPAGATIDSVSLRLACDKVAPGSGARTVQLRRVLADWGEGASNAGANGGAGTQAQSGDATWTDRFYNVSTWATDGGDFQAFASASTSVDNIGFYSWSSATMTTEVQGWLDSPGTNFGWILIGDESTTTTAKSFRSKDQPTANERPQLTIDFTSAGSGGAGRIPDGDVTPGTPLQLTKAGASMLQLSWGASCLVGDTDYEIYEGTLAAPFDSHTERVCSTAGSTTFTLSTPTGSAYYLVVPHNGADEGSYGLDSEGNERLTGLSACRDQALDTCP